MMQSFVAPPSYEFIVFSMLANLFRNFFFCVSARAAFSNSVRVYSFLGLLLSMVLREALLGQGYAPAGRASACRARLLLLFSSAGACARSSRGGGPPMACSIPSSDKYIYIYIY